ncbi:MAG: mannose-1-phosphate guanylyltransferase/mannose-6-phosphate isomerase [Dethiosulfovibrio sp.]|nr:mannose-1-phosphate guanylyltransferase/mannose-6-phosphate isomerase [Dethiosulfovibrio sp.]
MTQIKALILAGGGGTRLWPLSREEVPKQFLKLAGDHSLLQTTIKRLLPLCGQEGIKIVAGERWDSQIVYQASDVGLKGDILVLEPEGKNTAPAIALGLAHLMEKGATRETPVLVCPSDHIIQNEKAFHESLKLGLLALEEGKLVTFGIVPDAPETGFGYIKKGEDRGGWNDVSQFVEKPDLKKAKEYVQSGQYLWNGGIFLFRAGDMIDSFKEHLPEIAKLMECGERAMVEGFKDLPSVSIDYGIMEKAPSVAVVPLDACWSDLGSWDAIYQQGEKDGNRNVLKGDVLADRSEGCLVQGDRRLIALSGVSDLLVVDTADALFIAPRGTSQSVKDVVSTLKERSRPEITQAPESARRWGDYRILHEGDGIKVKRITVHPGKALSLQYHHHRTEHWIVVKGTAQVERDEEIFYLHEGESTFIQKNQLHRLINPGKIPLEIIEVQNGPYLGEDDIVRINGEPNGRDQEA